jgi:hypothetical protein
VRKGPGALTQAHGAPRRSSDRRGNPRARRRVPRESGEVLRLQCRVLRVAAPGPPSVGGLSQRRNAVSCRRAPGAPRSARANRHPELELLGARTKDRERRPPLWRRLAVSRWRASAVFGPTERNGSPRLGSSESSRRTEVVARFHGDVDASPRRLVDELFGALKRICSSGSGSSESGAGSGAPSVSTEVRVGSDPVLEALRSPRVGRWPVTSFQAGSDVFRGPSTLPFGARRSVHEVLKGSWLLTRAEGAG